MHKRNILNTDSNKPISREYAYELGGGKAFDDGLFVGDEHGAFITDKGRKVFQEDIDAYMNRPDVQDYIQTKIKEPMENWKLDRNAFVLETEPIPGSTILYPDNSMRNYATAEGMIHRNDGIKSLFPHPSTLTKNDAGNWVIQRDWNNPKVNYRDGGRLPMTPDEYLDRW
jgi:hypothetical protein